MLIVILAIALVNASAVVIACRENTPLANDGVVL